jgi:hypothetical protein
MYYQEIRAFSTYFRPYYYYYYFIYINIKEIGDERI